MEVYRIGILYMLRVYAQAAYIAATIYSDTVLIVKPVYGRV